MISGVRFQANMTLLHSSNTRGFFDPITLGFFVDGDLESLTKYKNDDIRLKTKATLHHELTHYFQFYGTTFGNLYLFHQWAGLAFNLTKLRKIQQEITALQTPLSQYVKSDDDEQYWVHLQTEKYYQQELYGFTHCFFRNEPLKVDKTKLLISSPLIMPIGKEVVYSIVGESVLESQAVMSEVIALGSDIGNRSLAAETITSYYDKLPIDDQLKYFSVSQILARYNLLKLEPVIYFIALNQANVNQAAFRNSEYELVRAIKRIVEKFPHFNTIDPPNNLGELNSLISKICKECNLRDPYDSIEEILKLRKSEKLSIGRAASWISGEVMTWILENKYEAVYWPQYKNLLLQSIPILNIRDDAYKDISYFNGTFPSIAKEQIFEHKYYSKILYLIKNLLKQNQFRCQYFIDIKPTICSSCENCSGYLPNIEIGEDCPNRQALESQGIYLNKIKAGD